LEEGCDCTIDNVAIALGINHEYVGDLRMILSSPVAGGANLVDQPSSDANLVSTNVITFDDRVVARDPQTLGDDVDGSGNILAGTYNAQGDGSGFGNSEGLGRFNGTVLPEAGDWTFEIVDFFSGNTGTIESVELAITCTLTSSPTFPCNLDPDERAAQIQALMETVSDPATFEDPGSPQSQALNWITNEDTISPIMCPNQENIGCSRGGLINPMIQRYVLAVFYFATEGDDWDQCSAPNDLDDPAAIALADANCDRVVTPYGVGNDRVGDTSTDAWLGPVNECEWGGVACWGGDTPNLNLCIDQLDFGKSCVCVLVILMISLFTHTSCYSSCTYIENDGLAGELAPELGD